MSPINLLEVFEVVFYLLVIHASQSEQPGRFIHGHTIQLPERAILLNVV